jgi:Flp pilus assembly protein TadB
MALEWLIGLLVSIVVFLLGYGSFYRGRLLRSFLAGRLATALTPPASLLAADPQSLEYRLAAAGLATDHPTATWLLLAWLPAFSAVLIGLSVGFPLAVTAGTAVVALIAPRRWLEGRVKQRGHRIDEALPTAYTRLGAILRASPDVARALGEVAASLEIGHGPSALSTELRQTALEAASGEIGREAALRRLQRRAASTSLANLGLLLERFEQTGAGEGGRFYEAFETAAQNVQGILEARQRAKAKAAEQLQSARIVPVLLAATLLFFMNDPGFKTAFMVPLVQMVLGLAVALMYFGYTLMADIAREAV